LVDLHFDQDHEGRIELIDQPVKILQLWLFDFEGRVFAYRVQYAPEALENGNREELAAASIVFFYDEDGSGKFKVARWPKLLKSNGMGYLPEFIPDWVKDRHVDPPKPQ